MGEFKHLAVVKFKDGAAVDEILKGLQDLISQVDTVKSFEWGQDLESHEMVRQGFTHVFTVTFGTKDEFDAYVAHPKHVEFSTVFLAAIEKVVVLDFHSISVKPTPAA
uniref:Stress-response A/B barrel domain-containing protein n=1 Tax=Kalanchoe fedtschenkoi TaxID=63787 RepID=A0A7N0ZV47_KALFE